MNYLSRLIKCSLLTTAVVSGVYQSHGQSVSQYAFGSAGGTSTATGGNTITYTVGEAIISTVGASPILSQGFNQPTLTTTPLPVKMEFNGEAISGANQLNWKTYQELNNDHFELERSADGAHFMTIAKIASKAPNGTSFTSYDYIYLDKAFTAGQNFYRIKQLDKSGGFAYSQIVALENKSLLSNFSLSPNPASSTIVLNTPEIGEVTVLDINGKVLQRMNADLMTTINISGFTPGAYFVNFKGATQSTTLRFVKN